MKRPTPAILAALLFATAGPSALATPAPPYVVQCDVISERGIKDTAGPMKNITQAYTQKFRVDPGRGTIVSLIRWDDDGGNEVPVENAVSHVWALTPDRLLFCMEEGGCLNSHTELDKIRFLSNHGPVEIDLKAGKYRSSDIYTAHLATGAVLSVYTKREGTCSTLPGGAP